MHPHHSRPSAATLLLTLMVLVASGCAGPSQPLSSQGAGTQSSEGNGSPSAPSSGSPAPTAPEPVVNDSSGSIAGVVVDEEEIPIPHVQVDIVKTDLETYTDASGKFTFNGLEAGSYGLALAHAGYDDAAQRVEVAAGQVAHPKIVMKAVMVADAPYYASIQKRAYIKAESVFMGSFGYLYNDTAMGVVGSLCSPCIFHLFIDKNPVDILTEPLWTVATGDPAINHEVFIQYAFGAANPGTYAYTGYSLNRQSFHWTGQQVSSLANVTDVRLLVHGGLKSVSVEHKPEVWSTFAYTAKLDANFTAMPPP